jgi:MSHA pilin protein MshC
MPPRNKLSTTDCEHSVDTTTEFIETIMRSPSTYRDGFTLVELVATLTIAGILAAVAGPRLLSSQPFSERGYADEVASALRQSRSVAMASGCAVRFTIDTSGYTAMQRSAAATHCSSNGAWVTPVWRGDNRSLASWPPSGTNVAAARTVVFAADGTISGGAPAAITIGPQIILIDAGGWVQRQ